MKILKHSESAQVWSLRPGPRRLGNGKIEEAWPGVGGPPVRQLALTVKPVKVFVEACHTVPLLEIGQGLGPGSFCMGQLNRKLIVCNENAFFWHLSALITLCACLVYCVFVHAEIDVKLNWSNTCEIPNSKMPIKTNLPTFWCTETFVCRTFSTTNLTAFNDLFSVQ